MSEWPHKLFVEHGDLYLKILNARWEQGKKSAAGIAHILEKHELETGKVLDLMCGNGRIAIPLAKKGYEIVGIDFSPTFLDDARKHAKEHKVEESVNFIQGDVRKIGDVKFEETFDAIINVWTSIGYFGKKHDRKLFKKLKAICSSKGLLGIFQCGARERILNIFEPTGLKETEDIAIVERRQFNLLTSTMEMTWKFYKKGEDWKHIHDFNIEHYLYSVSELVNLLEETGWEVKELYKSLSNVRAFPPDKLQKPLQVINLIASNI